MALNKCNECGHDVSSKAKQCPNCSAPTYKPFVGLGKGIAIIFFCLIVIGILSNNTDVSRTPSSRHIDTEWFKNGNLHDATVSQWKRASYRNKLATASDWLVASKWKGHLNSPDDFNRLKRKAAMLVRGVDKVVDVAPNSQRIAVISTSLIIMAADLGP